MTAAVHISLLVCTRNRCDSLARTLASMTVAAQAAGEVPVEVIVVDNGSTDATDAVVTAWQAAQDFPVHLVHTRQPGLSHARNAGLARARGAIIAMTDDDCVLHTDFLPRLAAVFALEDAPAIIGGRIELGDPADLPITIKVEDHPMIARPERFPGGFVMGANLAFCATIPALIGPFDPRFGAGAPFLAAEDTDFLLRALQRGIAVKYDPTFAVDHHHGRREAGDGVALLAGYSFGDGALYARHLLRDRRIARAIGRDVLDIARDFRSAHPPHPSIRRFYTFRLRHKLRGFAAYLTHRAIRIPASGRATQSG